MRLLVLIVFCFYSQFILAEKKIVLTPFQTNIKDCVDKKIDVQKINSNKKLYQAIEKFYALSTSETVFREVLYSQKGEQKKLKYENGLIQIYRIDDEDDSLSLLSSEKFGERAVDYQARHKLRNAESRINQLLFRADIKSDYQKIKETRAKQVVLNIIWSDNQIKSLNIEFSGAKKVLNCIQKEQTDICSCRP